MRWVGGRSGLLFATCHLALGCGASSPPSPSFDPTCEGRADQYSPGIEKSSSDGELTVRIVSAIPDPPANTDDNRWTASLVDVSGTPMEGATVVAAPFMVDHGHGAPNVIGIDLGGGSYALEPIYLKMTGLWDVTIKAYPPGSEPASEPPGRVIFSFCVPPV